MVDSGFVDETGFYHTIADALGAEYVDLGDKEIPPTILKLIPSGLARLHRALPIGLSGNTLRVALADPLDPRAAEDLRFALGKDVDVVVAPTEQIDNRTKEYYGAAPPSRVAGHLPRQSDGEHEHRRAASAPGWPHSKKYRRSACRSSRFDFADSIWRERRFARTRSLDRESRPGNARDARVRAQLHSRNHQSAKWNFYCHRPDRFRKNDDALFLLAQD